MYTSIFPVCMESLQTPKDAVKISNLLWNQIQEIKCKRPSTDCSASGWDGQIGDLTVGFSPSSARSWRWARSDPSAWRACRSGRPRTPPHPARALASHLQTRAEVCGGGGKEGAVDAPGAGWASPTPSGVTHVEPQPDRGDREVGERHVHVSCASLLLRRHWRRAARLLLFLPSLPRGKRGGRWRHRWTVAWPMTASSLLHTHASKFHEFSRSSTVFAINFPMHY